MKSINKKIASALTLGMLVTGLAGTSIAGAPAASARSATVADYVASDSQIRAGGGEVNVIPLIAAALAGALAAEVLHHHVERGTCARNCGVGTTNDTLFDL